MQAIYNQSHIIILMNYFMLNEVEFVITTKKS